jgi:hypothetical protein
MKQRLRWFAVSNLVFLLLLIAGVGYYVRNAKPVSLHEEVVKAQIAESGLEGTLALKLYPAITPRLYELYGNDPEFVQMLHEFGPNQTFPIMAKCLERGDAFVKAQLSLQDALRHTLNPALPFAQPDPVACGRQMVHQIVTERNIFLARFSIDANGEAHRLPVTTLTSKLDLFFTNGLRKVERHWVTPGEHVTSGDAVEASLDVVGLFGAGKALFLVKNGATFAAFKSGLFGVVKVAAPKAIIYGLPPAICYVAITHPRVLIGLGNMIGGLWGQALVWAVPLFCLMLITSFLWFYLRPIAWCLAAPVRLIRRRMAARAA